jgi:HD-like signal output (HDOD) protein
VQLEHYEGLLKDLAIPPRPDVVTVLVEEMGLDEPDLNRVTKVIAKDPGLAAGMLRAANSPFFGLNRAVSSVPKAISVLGLKHFSNIATGLAIRFAMSQGDKAKRFERFWDTAEKSALMGHYFAEKLRGVAADEAYTFGLFHDCGIPLLMQRFPHYEETLKRANEAEGVGFAKVEEVEIGTSHNIVGYFLARSWLLSDDMCQAILRHHEVKVFEDPAVHGNVLSLIGIGHLTEHVQHLSMRSSEDVEWGKFQTAVMDHFALTEEDLLNLQDGAQAILAG